MKKSLIWYLFLILVAMLTIWFAGSAAYALLSYSRLSVKVPATVEEWLVKEVKNDQFALQARFTFEFEGKRYHGTSLLGTFYPNPWAAHKAQAQLSNAPLPVWLNPDFPDQAVLFKKFPFKKVISAAILIALSVYFFILNAYVKIKR